MMSGWLGLAAFCVGEGGVSFPLRATSRHVLNPLYVRSCTSYSVCTIILVLEYKKIPHGGTRVRFAQTTDIIIHHHNICQIHSVQQWREAVPFLPVAHCLVRKYGYLEYETFEIYVYAGYILLCSRRKAGDLSK
jgi:hypothetical protein